MFPVPKIDERTSQDIAAEVRTYLAHYVPEWGELDQEVGQTASFSAGLIEVFSRFTEHLITALNRAPERNFLKFLDLLGASQLPPQPARVPLTFSLAPGSEESVVIPKGTQVAGASIEEEPQPVVFETEKAVMINPIRLCQLGTRNPYWDRYSLIAMENEVWPESGISLIEGDYPIEHVLYIGHCTLFGFERIKEIRLSFDVKHFDESELDHREVRWEMWNGERYVPLVPQHDQTDGLKQSGHVVFSKLSQLPIYEVDGMSSRWIRCQLLTPISPGRHRKAKTIRAAHLPLVESVRIQVSVHEENVILDEALANGVLLDLSKEWWPFGERPKFGDVVYLASNSAFSIPKGKVTLSIDLVNPITGDEESPIKRTNGSRGATLSWEVWDGKQWTEIGRSQAGQKAHQVVPGFQDTTQALTQPGEVIIPLPPQTKLTNPNHGMDNYWIRVRLVGGDYGQDARYELRNGSSPEEGYVIHAATFAAPCIKAISAAVSFESGEIQPEILLTLNDSNFVHVTDLDRNPSLGCFPFEATKDCHASVYLGFQGTPQNILPSQPHTLFFVFVHSECQVIGRLDKGPNAKPAHWEYWNGHRWKILSVIDETRALRQSGFVRFMIPQDFVSHEEFGVLRYWIRILLPPGTEEEQRLCMRILSNTVMAEQSTTYQREVLGSSNGTPDQYFQALHVPILAGPQIEVFEPEDFLGANEHTIKEPNSSVPPSAANWAGGETGSLETWMTWHQVNDFYGSGPHDPHYVLNHVSGQIHFGDGNHGRIPPSGKGNIRIGQYKIGGGIRGNLPPETVTQLLAGIPSVDRVTNLIPGTGGADLELLNELRQRAPRELRHQNRAVTKEDFEDLAQSASPEVARATCIPMTEWDPLSQSFLPAMGVVTIVIIPKTDAARPLPSPDLLAHVHRALIEQSLPGLQVQLVPPFYHPIDVEATIIVRSLEEIGSLQETIMNRLNRFLHPLHGGRVDEGWVFGEQPEISDLYAVIQAIEGVSYISQLHLHVQKAQEKTSQRDWALVCSGQHRINIVLASTTTVGEL